MENENPRITRAKAAILNFAKAIEGLSYGTTFDENFVKSVDAILEHHKDDSKIVTTGMGKAGRAMEKFSSTLCSFGVRSCFLHPGEASHGDSGIISPRDLLFVASTSGKTKEIIDVIDIAKKIGVKCIIGVTSHPDSVIRTKADFTIDMGEIKEEDSLGLAPTTSILIMQAITDSLAIVISEELKVTTADFGKYHHSGYLGALARGDGNIL